MPPIALLKTNIAFLFIKIVEYTIGVFISRLIGKPLPNHATIAWFSLYKKTYKSVKMLL